MSVKIKRDKPTVQCLNHTHTKNVHTSYVNMNWTVDNYIADSKWDRYKEKERLNKPHYMINLTNHAKLLSKPIPKIGFIIYIILNDVDVNEIYGKISNH